MPGLLHLVFVFWSWSSGICLQHCRTVLLAPLNGNAVPPRPQGLTPGRRLVCGLHGDVVSRWVCGAVRGLLVVVAGVVVGRCLCSFGSHIADAQHVGYAQCCDCCVGCCCGCSRCCAPPPTVWATHVAALQLMSVFEFMLSTGVACVLLAWQ